MFQYHRQEAIKHGGSNWYLYRATIPFPFFLVGFCVYVFWDMLAVPSILLVLHSTNMFRYLGCNDIWL